MHKKKFIRDIGEVTQSGIEFLLRLKTAINHKIAGKANNIKISSPTQQHRS